MLIYHYLTAINLDDHVTFPMGVYHLELCHLNDYQNFNSLFTNLIQRCSRTVLKTYPQIGFVGTEAMLLTMLLQVIGFPVIYMHNMSIFC